METEKHYKQLDYQDRLAIALGKEQGLSIRAIARILKRSPSSISRECLRNSPSGLTTAPLPSNAMSVEDALHDLRPSSLWAAPCLSRYEVACIGAGHQNKSLHI